MLALINKPLGEFDQRLKELESPYLTGDRDAYSIKLPDGTLISTVRITIPAQEINKNVYGSKLWHTKFAKLNSVTYCIEDKVGGTGNIASIGSANRTGFITTTSNLETAKIYGYTYNEPIADAMSILVTGVGKWK